MSTDEHDLDRVHQVIHENELERSRLEGSLSTIVAQITSTRMQLQDKKFKKIDQVRVPL